MSSRGGLGGKCKTMFTQVFVSSPGGSNPSRGYINRNMLSQFPLQNAGQCLFELTTNWYQLSLYDCTLCNYLFIFNVYVNSNS